MASTAVQASLLRIYGLSHPLLDPRGLFHSRPRPDQRTLSDFNGNGIIAIFLDAKRITESWLKRGRNLKRVAFEHYIRRARRCCNAVRGRLILVLLSETGKV